ncbi:hypothetical protein ACFLIM_40690 [Nonomuraea sp. M3C6]|uniref:Peptidase inhibitor family I36 n=1 Tax=Nonomuraea marmarensis TaxID=3351344 RepID=A0ABW7AQ49_9ACTN
MMTTAAITSTATPAKADPPGQCRVFCGVVHNKSSQRILVSNAWCGNGYRVPGAHPCAHWPDWRTNKYMRWLYPGQKSNIFASFRDTDAFLVDRHCTVKWLLHSGAELPITAGSKELWVRVRGIKATITSVSCDR